MRRTELWLAAVLLAAAAVAAYVGGQQGWGEEVADNRRSTHLSGPNGARSVAEVLEELGVTVTRHDRAFFRLPTFDEPWVLALLDLWRPPTDVELDSLAAFVNRGGHIVSAGMNALEACAGWDHWSSGSDDELRLRPAQPAPGLDLPPSTAALIPAAGENDEADWCDIPFETARVDTLMRLGDTLLAAARLHTRGGGTVTFVADGTLFSNRTWRDTDAALVLIPWMTGTGGRHIVFDEYHHGFGHDGSMWSAAFSWLTATPPGWMILQLIIVAFVGAWILGLRFGRPRPPLTVARRSELEHVEALGYALQRANSEGDVLRLYRAGLQRRLARHDAATHATSQDPDWIAGFDHVDTPEGRAALTVLRTLNTQPRDMRALRASRAVEDLWKALSTPTS